MKWIKDTEYGGWCGGREREREVTGKSTWRSRVRQEGQGGVEERNKEKGGGKAEEFRPNKNVWREQMLLCWSCMIGSQINSSLLFVCLILPFMRSKKWNIYLAPSLCLPFPLKILSSVRPQEQVSCTCLLHQLSSRLTHFQWLKHSRESMPSRLRNSNF